MADTKTTREAKPKPPKREKCIVCKHPFVVLEGVPGPQHFCDQHRETLSASQKAWAVEQYTKTCPVCQGAKKRRQEFEDTKGKKYTMVAFCPDCHGTGRIPKS